MGCATCANNDGSGTPTGCRNNGTCSSGGCNKLEVFDWLANMEIPAGRKAFDCVEVRFKNSRKSFYKNTNKLDINVGDVVAVEASPGYDIGIVTIVGEMARIQMEKKGVAFDSNEVRKLYRKGEQAEIDKWKEAREMEWDTMHRARKMALDLGLVMKISDVEYQGDKSKATFYYTADDRVDFRELIKIMADAFKIRIEMRQIGARQEASRLGGIGSCGRELCCSTWLTDFRSVSTSAARYQQLSLNPQKLAGQCGKLKCCLNYELDMYLEIYKDMPSLQTKLRTKKGMANCIKIDIFKRTMWFIYEEDRVKGPIPLGDDRVKEIIAMNKAGKEPEDLQDFMEIVEVEELPDYDNVVGQDSLTRFDNKNRNKRRKKKKKGGGPAQAKAQGGGAKPGQGGNKKGGGGNRRKSSGGGQGNKPKQGGNQPKAQAKGGSSQGGNKSGGSKPRRSRGGNNKSKPQNSSK